MRHLLTALIVLLAASSSVRAALLPAQVLVLVNKDTSISSQVAKMYQAARGIPAANVLSLSMGTQRQITPEQYWKFAPEIRKALEANPAIRCVLTTSGVPYTIQVADGKEDGAAFDSQLAVVLIENAGDRKRRQPNPLFVMGANVAGQGDPRARKMVFVARLDGPDLKTITRMVEDAVAVEKTGLEGPVFGDAQGLQTITGYGLGDATIRQAIDRLSGAGFVSKLDLKQESWKKPANGPGDQAAGAAFYVGWYDLINFQDIFGKTGLARGSIAWHIASQEAQNLWDPNNLWAPNLMKRGAAVTIGPVREPYVDAFPRGDVFTEALLAGSSVAESYWLALPHTSWAMVLLGDPMYSPFSVKPRASLIARAYVADNASHILGAGQTSPLLLQIESVGPVGNSTPAMTATVEVEMGLTAASGMVSIPALQTGGVAIVKIPSVTAGADPTGLFRLALNAQDDQKRSRRIVLEGRIGMSRISGGLLPKMQLYLRGDGRTLVTGQPGRNFQMDPATLAWQALKLPDGYGIIAAEYSPDGTRLAMTVASAQTQKSGSVIADPKTGTTQNLPAGARFLRWVTKDEVLVAIGNQVTRHSLSGGADRPIGTVAGCLNAAAGSVIPGTDIVYVTTPQGKTCVQEGTRAPREAMAGVNATKFGAVANDLSLFGAVDAEKRLWIQHGFDAKPEIVATGVERVQWGPISRRALVVEAGQRGRVYDGPTGTWTDLGVVSAAAWSPNEERLIFTDAGENSSLSVLTGNRVAKLAPMSIMGSLAAISITDAGDKAFMLAGIGGGLDVWMMALPPK